MEQTIHMVRAALALLRAGLLRTIVDRAMLLTDLVVAVLIPFAIQYLIWTAIYAGRAKQAEIQGFTHTDLLFYFAFALVMGRLNNGYDLIEKGAEQVHEGTLDSQLVKPFPVILQKFFIFLGESLIYLVPITIVIGARFAFNTSPDHLPVIGIAALGLVALLPLLQILCFLLSYLYVCLSVFVVRAELLLILQLGFLSLFGGLLLPPDFWPIWAQPVMRYNPYSFLIALPAQFLAKPSWGLYLELPIGLVTYSAFLGVCVNFLWNHVVRQYESVGG